MDRRAFQSSVDRLARRELRRRIAAVDLDIATPQERSKIIQFVAAIVDSMSDADVAYGTYAMTALPDNRDLKKLQEALTMAYRKRLLKWFTHAIQIRAKQGGGGTGLKNLKAGIVAFIENLPHQLVRGYSPMSAFVRGNVTEIVDDAKLDAASAKIFRVVAAEAGKSGLNVRIARSPGLSLEWDAANRVWFIPPNPATFDIKTQLSRGGFRWNNPKRRWEGARLTPAIKKLIPDQRATPAPVAPTGPATLVDEVSDWFFDTWLPRNISRFDTVFNAYIKSDETSYAFTFSLKARKVVVTVDRDLKGPKDAVEELRYRYLGRQGRGPWLEVLDRYVELTKTTTMSKVILLIDRMNNLQHSNGLFMEHFPKSVQSWYEQFLNRKYSAKSAHVLAGFIHDSDLRDVIRWHDFSNKPTFRDRGQGAPAIPIETKNLPEGVNWRQKGYPRERGFKQPGRRSPEVQRDLDRMPNLWDPQKP